MARTTKKKQTITRTKKTASKAFGPNSVRDALWENIQSVQEGRLAAKDANSISASARVICQNSKLQLDAAKLMGKVNKSTLKKIGVM